MESWLLNKKTRKNCLNTYENLRLLLAISFPTIVKDFCLSPKTRPCLQMKRSNALASIGRYLVFKIYMLPDPTLQRSVCVTGVLWAPNRWDFGKNYLSFVACDSWEKSDWVVYNGKVSISNGLNKFILYDRKSCKSSSDGKYAKKADTQTNYICAFLFWLKSFLPFAFISCILNLTYYFHSSYRASSYAQQ
jgi:hypothetical protein